MTLGLILAGALMAVALAAPLVFARWYCRPRRRLRRADPGSHSLPFEQVGFASQGVRLAGWYIAPAPARAPRPAVVLVHGWSANALQMMPLAALVHQVGFGALIFHARGHGTSERDGPVTIASFARTTGSHRPPTSTLSGPGQTRPWRSAGSLPDAATATCWPIPPTAGRSWLS